MISGLIVFSGLVGSGKSTLANHVGKLLNIPVISGDVVRKTLMGFEPTDKCGTELNSGIYSLDVTKFVNGAIYDAVEWYIRNGKLVSVDECLFTTEQRKPLLDIVKRYRAKYLFAMCVLDEETTRMRLELRSKERTYSDGNYEVYQYMKREFEHPNEIPNSNMLLINTYYPISVCGQIVMERIHVL